VTVQQKVVRLTVAAGTVMVVLVTGQPAPALAMATGPAVASEAGPSPEELLAGQVTAPEPDPRRRAEESGGWAPGRPRPTGVAAVPVRAAGSGPWPQLPDLPAPAVRRAPMWPEPGGSVVTVPESGRGAQAGRAPVWLSAPAAGRTGAPVPAGTEVSVAVQDRAAARRLGGAVAVGLRLPGSGPGGVVELTVDYAGFAAAAGGDYGSRLRATAYQPECAPGCPGEPLVSRNDPVERTVTAQVPLTGDGSTTLVLLTTGTGGPAGDWAATSLSPAAQWSHGGHTGDFSWSYPLPAPELPGGLAPELAISYSSGSVDGRTLSTNNQTSWIGEGFDLASGYIERRYIPCLHDMENGANNTIKTGDLCWKSDNAVLSLGGTATELVKDASTGVWRPKRDDASRVQRSTGADNGARDGEYWRVTIADGTQYFFGRHARSAGDTQRTNSVLTVPVAGNHSGEPCHASSFGSSFCAQAWRWNLDYVVDPNGNTMTYFYTRESNRYGQNRNDTSVSYHPGGYLSRIDYGQRQGSEHTTPAPGRVVFTVAERCLPGGGSSCAAGELTESTADQWPDVPYDRICSSSSSCPERVSPAFFTRKRLTQVETQVRVSGSYQPVDRWTLTHAFPEPGDGNSPALWLDRITHSGLAGGTLTLPSVQFSGIPVPNRVPEIDTAPLVNRYRVLGITTETGAVVSVNYSAPDCQPGGTMPTPHTNGRRCFPVYWKPEGAEHDDPEIYWFHKYLVDTVTEIDGTGGGVERETHYSYGGPAAWAYRDDEFVKPAYRTWGEWRGYGTVTTRVGNPSTDQLRTQRLYLRGMHGDRAGPSGGTRSVTVTDSRGGTVTDHEHWAGVLREEIVFDGSATVSSTVHDPWRSAVTASGGGKEARMVNVAATRVHTSLAAGGWRTTEAHYSYDGHGLLVLTDDRGDVATSADDRCTRVEYAKNTGAWILATAKRSETVAKQCPVTPSRPGDVVSDERTSYDGGSYGAVPTKGNPTRTEVLDSWSSGPVYLTTARFTYDAHGRIVSQSDALNRATTTAYTPATGGPVSQVAVTNPAGHTTLTHLEPRRGLPTRVTDANGRDVEATYDPLGRLRQVWQTDRSRATETPTVEYTYRVSATLPVAVTTRALLPSGGYATSVELYDALLRLRQAQSPAAGDTGGRLVTDLEYDSRGLAVEQKGPYFATGAPSTTLVDPTTTVPSRLLSSYDGAGRVRVERLMVHQSEHSRTTTSYDGDRVHMTPPAGGTAATTITDARGRTTELREYHGPGPTGSYDVTRFTYTARDELATMTDPVGNTWQYGYDLRGRRTTAVDPDAGVSATVYDAVDQVVLTTDARGQTLAYRYDALDRRIETRAGSAAGPLLAKRTYDTLEKGYLSSSTSFHGGAAYTSEVFAYDDGYRPLGEIVTIPASEGALAGRYESYRSYHPDGSLRLHWRPGIGGLPQETLFHNYDAAGRPEWLTGARTYVADTRYSPFSEVEQYSLGVDLGRANWQTFFYEEGTRRLQRMRVDREGVTSPDVDRSYTYDRVGNPLSVADTGSPGAADVQCFSYDHQRRLIEAWAQGTTGCASQPAAAVVGGAAAYWHSYAYNSAGNRTGLTVHGVEGSADTVTSYTHPATGQPGPHRVTSTHVQSGTQPVATTSYGYDPAGNLTSVSGPEGATSYQWDEQGRLASITTPDGTGGAVYTADGARLIRRTPDGTTLYLGGDEYTLDHDTGQVTGTRYYQLGSAILVMRTGGTISSLATDHQRTPVAVIDQANQLTRRWQDPFGNPRGPQPANWPGDRGFHTGTEDTWAGLVHLGARPYDPVLGRFLAVDPLISLGDSQQAQGYSYANHNPLLLTDPAGLEPRPWHNPNFTPKSKGWYDNYWANERKAFGCNSCGKSGQRPWTTSSTSHQLGGQHGGNTRSRGSSTGPAGGHQGDTRPRPIKVDQVARSLEAKIERLVVESGLFNMCLANVPDVTGQCQDGARFVAKLYTAALTNAVCPPGGLGLCTGPLPDYLSVELGGKSKAHWMVHLKTTATVTVTRTGKVFTNSTVGVGLGGSKTSKWEPLDIRAGWVYDGERRASDAQVSSYPNTGLNAEASVSITGLGGLLGAERSVSTNDNGSLHAVDVSVTSPSLIDAELGASVSYGDQVADIGQLWR
jgi:RHS repeat-associated protein